MLGLFGIFGRSRDIQRLDEGVRAAGLHPRLVPDAVKIAAVKMVKEARGPDGIDDAAPLLAYCMLGPEMFAADNGPAALAEAEARMAAAIRSGDSLDARLVLLALGSGVIHPAATERHGLEIG